MSLKPLDRRRCLALLASTALAAALGRAQAAPGDQGIGGTGAAPSTDGSDRGIGGTGVIGTIRKFGSIVVNDLRIAYPADAEVRIDGLPASVADLKIGQVVRVDASSRAGGLSTRTIDVASEVVGPVERIGAKQITVLGQTVSTAALKSRRFKTGETVAVSGLRRNDGTIVASLIEPRTGAPSRVAGLVRKENDGAVKIGGLQLTGLDPALVGRRAIVEGEHFDDRLAVARGARETALLPNIRTLSIESYVERRGDRLSLGSGYALGEGQRLDIPAGRSVRAVLTTRVGSDGRLDLEGARVNGRTFGNVGVGGNPGRHGGPNGSGAGGGRMRAPGRSGPGNGAPGNGRIPMDFERRIGGPGGEPASKGVPPGFGGPGGGGGPRGFGGGGFGGRR